MFSVRSQPQKSYLGLEFRPPLKSSCGGDRDHFVKVGRCVCKATLFSLGKMYKRSAEYSMMQKERLKISQTLNESTHLGEKFKLTLLSTEEHDCWVMGSLHPESEYTPHPICLLPGAHWAVATGPVLQLPISWVLPLPQPLPAIKQD